VRFATIAVHPHPTIRARDTALLAVLYGAGLRRAEAVALDLTDYALDAWLAVRGGVPGSSSEREPPAPPLSSGRAFNWASIFLALVR
jgi:site-specific recombinase XerC